MIKKIPFLFIILCQIALPAVAFAWGGGPETYLDSGSISVPSTSQKDVAFNASYKVTNNSTKQEDKTLHTNYTLDQCIITSSYTDGRTQTKPVVSFNSGSIQTETMGTVTLSQTSSMRNSITLKANKSFVVPHTQTATISVNVTPNSSELNENDAFYFRLDCSFWDDTQRSTPTTTDFKQVTIKAPEPEPTPQPEPTPTPEPTPDSEPASQQNSDQTSTPQPEPTTTPEPTKAPIASAQIPDSFKQEGSTTTDLANLSKDDAKAIDNFTLENKENGKITFQESIDLSGDDLKDKFEKLDEYVKINKGSVEIDSENLAQLNKKARITLYDLNLAKDNILIKRNGQDAGDYVSDIVYEEQKNLQFTVSEFSLYEVYPDLELKVEDELTSSNPIYRIEGSVGDLDSTLKITINDEKQNVDYAINEDGTFDFDLALSTGKNDIMITALSSSGAQESQTTTITYRSTADDIGSTTENKGDNLAFYLFIGFAAVAVLGLTTYFLIFQKMHAKKG